MPTTTRENTKNEREREDRSADRTAVVKIIRQRLENLEKTVNAATQHATLRGAALGGIAAASMEIKRARGRWTTTDDIRARRRLGALHTKMRNVVGTDTGECDDMDWEPVDTAISTTKIRMPPLPQPKDMDQGTP